MRQKQKDMIIESIKLLDSMFPSKYEKVLDKAMKIELFHF